MAETKQISLNEKDIALIKANFKGNDYLLKAVRSLFFGFELNEDDLNLLKSTFSNNDLKEAVRKKMFPKLSNDVPIGQVADFWMGTESQIFGASTGAIYQAVQSKQKVHDMLVKAFDLLSNPQNGLINLDYNANQASADELQVGLLARNLYIRTVETGLMYVQLVAEQNQETDKETKIRESKDSVE